MSHSDKGGASASAARGATHNANEPSVEGGESELVANLVELFREVDVNGDGVMEWEEFTRFIVEKAALFKEQNSLDRIPEYRHNVRTDAGGIGTARHRNMLDRICFAPDLRMFAVTEQHSSVVALYDARSGARRHELRASTVPLSVCYVEPRQSFVASCSDMTMVEWHVLDGSGSGSVRAKERAKWPTPDTQMALCWADAQNLIYSGSTTGTVHAWSIEQREQRACLEGHKDIVMEVLYLKVSGSLFFSLFFSE